MGLEAGKEGLQSLMPATRLLMCDNILPIIHLSGPNRASLHP